ncbi:MAG: hypothetical protein IJD93_05090 [Ruminococcus sp.]|nr:hypothetical protein [Ruminococcus sp.]
MAKLDYLVKRIKEMNFGRMLDTVEKVHIDSGKGHMLVLFDMIVCAFKYQAGYSDYALFEMYKLNKAQRSTVVTRGINNSFIKEFNNPEYTELINNKLRFARLFSDFMHRDWLDLTTAPKEEFADFVKKHPEFIAKPASGMCGKGIQKINAQASDLGRLREYLIGNDLLLLEEIIVQHPAMHRLHPYSVNTCRIVTLHKDGKTKVVVAYLRIGNGRLVDNFNSAGMVVPINENTGLAEFCAVDKQGKLYEKHPITYEAINGFRVPDWEEVLSLVKKAGAVVPQVGLVGWDVALSDRGPLLVEGNNFPGHDIYGLPAHCKNGIGVLPKFKEAIKNLSGR